MAQSPTAASASEFIEQFNTDYARIHEAYENHFWSTKMNLQGNSTDALTKSFNELEQFLGNQTALATTRTLLADDSVTKPQKNNPGAIRKDPAVLHRGVRRRQGGARVRRG